MNTNKILLAALVGGVAAFILGFLFYGILLNDFFQTNAGTATGVMRGEGEMLWIPMILGHLSWGLLFALIFGRWAEISTFTSGAKAGATIGFLVGFTDDLIDLGSTHLSSTTGVIANIIVMTLISAIVGGVVGWMLGRGSSG